MTEWGYNSRPKFYGTMFMLCSMPEINATQSVVRMGSQELHETLQRCLLTLQATFGLPLLEISVFTGDQPQPNTSLGQPQATVKLEALQLRGGRLLRQTSGTPVEPQDALGPQPLYALGLSIGPLQVRLIRSSVPETAYSSLMPHSSLH